MTYPVNTTELATRLESALATEKTEQTTVGVLASLLDVEPETVGFETADVEAALAAAERRLDTARQATAHAASLVAADLGERQTWLAVGRLEELDERGRPTGPTRPFRCLASSYDGTRDGAEQWLADVYDTSAVYCDRLELLGVDIADSRAEA